MPQLIETKVGPNSFVRCATAADSNRLNLDCRTYYCLTNFEFGIEAIGVFEPKSTNSSLQNANVVLKIWIDEPYRAVSSRVIDIFWRNDSPVVFWDDRCYGDRCVVNFSTCIYPLIFDAFQTASAEVAADSDFQAWTELDKICKLIEKVGGIMRGKLDESAIEVVVKSIFR